MGNHNGYQRQLILARLTRVDECMENDTLLVGDETPIETQRLVIELERLMTVALGRGFSRDDFVDRYGFDYSEQDDIVHDRINESLVEAAIQSRDDSLFDALVALVPTTTSTE